MRVVTITLSLCLCSFLSIKSLNAQHVDIQSPLNIPLFLSGNFGELRSTHFHAGIDLKTQGKIGQPVKAISSGYVSRVKVQAGGYGNAIYIKHIDGYTSVYGHLDSFFPEVAAYVKSEQYRQKSFEVDLYLEENKFVVTQGMIIGLSGNTGRSGGPHLHLELRDNKQVPMNVLLYGLPIKDTISPKMRRLFLYDNVDSETFQWQNKISVPIVGNNGEYSISKVLKGTSSIAFGIEVYDYLNGSSNRCGVYTLDLFVDSSLVFSNNIDKVSFGETRYIRTYSDYEEKKLNRRGVHRLFMEPNNNLSIYKEVLNRGILRINDTLLHKGKIIATDAYGNKSNLRFKFIVNSEQINSYVDSGIAKFNFAQDNIFEDDMISFKVPANALYANKWFNFSVIETGEEELSDIYSLGDELIPLHKSAELSIKPKGNLDGVSPEKLVVARIETDGDFSSEGGRWIDGRVKAKVSGFGQYTLMVDTISPTIKPVSFREGWYAAGDVISFKINDELSGIKTYNGYINDNWGLFSFDAKSGTLSYKIDKDKLSRSKNPHTLKIYVMDERNNIQSFSAKFFY
jgi:hypothetical protein